MIISRSCPNVSWSNPLKPPYFCWKIFQQTLDAPGHFKESSPEDQSALPRALSTGPEGPVGAVAERAPEGGAAGCLRMGDL